MPEMLIQFLVFLIIVVVVLYVVDWLTKRFIPDLNRPAMLVVGAILLIAFIYQVLRLLRGTGVVG